MSKSFIALGTINKKLLLPFFLAGFQISYIIFNKYYPVSVDNFVIQRISIALGEMSVKFLPCILKIDNKEELKEKEYVSTKRKIIHYIILSGIYLVNSVMTTLAKIYDLNIRGIQIEYVGSDLFLNIDFILMGFEMIFMILISIKLLKYKYYKHHIYSSITLIIFGIISELCLETYFKKDSNFFIGQLIKVVGTVSDAIFYCFEKYMMEKYYYPYWNIAFVPGLIYLIISIIVLIVVLLDKNKENSGHYLISTFYKFFTDGTLGLSIGRIVFIFVMHLIICPLTILNIYYFSPNFILIIFQISRIANNLINNSVNKLYCIVFYAIQFLALMIHLEIIELNFCGLNKNTKKNIDLRGIDDISLERQDSMLDQGSIDINKDYSIEKLENNDKAFEMKEQEGQTID